MGGEEFCCLLPGTTLAEGLVVGRRICAEFSAGFVEAMGAKIRCTVSVGVSSTEITGYNIDELQASGQLERPLRSGARFAAKAIVLDAVERGEAATVSTRRIGPALAFERVWQETGCRSVIERLASRRGHEFSLERAAFLTVLHRLFAGGSDRAADRWGEDYAIDGVEDLDLHHLYRAKGRLKERPSFDELCQTRGCVPTCYYLVCRLPLRAPLTCMPYPCRQHSP